MRAVLAHGGVVAVHDLAVVGAMLLVLAGVLLRPILRGLGGGRGAAATAPRRPQAVASASASARRR